MPKESRNARNLIKLITVLGLMLLVVVPIIPGQSAAAKTITPDKNNPPGRTHLIASPAAAPSGTFQDFDLPNTGTPYAIGVYDSPRTPARIDGGPTNAGKTMRLAFGAPIPTKPPLNLTTTQNSIAFNRSNLGPSDQVVADFDFRITPGIGRADGFGFALLKTAVPTYTITGPVAPHNVAEEPDFMGSLGIGFDIYRSDEDHLEINDNHISLHFGRLVKEFDAKPALDLAGGQWIHARIIMRPGGGYSDVTVILAQCGRPPATVVDHVMIPGFTPYEWRAYFAARSGGLMADQDIDNIHVQALSLDQSVLAFRTGCASMAETGGQQHLIVDRMGNLNGIVRVNYATAAATATPGADFTATSGTLTFNAGESAKLLNLPILNDAGDESDERFLVSLSDPTVGAVVGGPAIASVTIIDDEAARRVGHWSEVIPSQVVPIHMHLLPTGKVLYWDRHDDHDTHAAWDGNPRLWDPTTQVISATTVPTLTYDIFCSGHSFLANGSLLVTGGHINGTTGEDEASIYNPFSNTWTRLPQMNAGRWYPSNVTLPSGDVLVMGGTNENGLNTLPQVWQTADNSWRDLTNARQGDYPDYANYYPFLYVAPNGKVFVAGPQQVARYLDTSGTGAWTDVATSTLAYREYGSSVMYDEGKVLIVGGNPQEPDLTGKPRMLPSDKTEVIDLNAARPRWRSVGSLHIGRRQLNTTLLPDGKVLATGGSSLPLFDDQSGALEAELWDPATEQWTVMATPTRYRGYHSTALLLPDGRVLVGGGGHPDPAIGAQYNFEIYSPPYLFKGPRPTITNAPQQVTYGQSFSIQTPSAASIARVNLVRLSSVTHAFNQNQRINHLAITSTSGAVTVTAPANPNLAPPGHYMLFILNGNGVPSVARIIQLVN